MYRGKLEIGSEDDSGNRKGSSQLECL